MQAIISAHNLMKSFGETSLKQGEYVLKGIDLSIYPGEFVAIMGQSGSGKSTLLYNISGMDLASGGEIFFDGGNLLEYSEEEMSSIRLKKMGFIFQHAYLLKNMSIEDNILLPGYKAAKESRKAVQQRTQELMKRMGIENIRDHDSSKVSGGQLQRAAICRALVNSPDIIFADEPTGALNSATTFAVMDILNQINAQGTAMLLVTHDARVAARADRIVFLEDGKIKAQCQLGKYKKESQDLISRERAVTTFLAERGF